MAQAGSQLLRYHLVLGAHISTEGGCSHRHLIAFVGSFHPFRRHLLAHGFRHRDLFGAYVAKKSCRLILHGCHVGNARSSISLQLRHEATHFFCSTHGLCTFPKWLGTN